MPDALAIVSTLRIMKALDQTVYNTFMSPITVQLRYWREKRKLSQVQLAELAHVTQAMVSDIERGKTVALQLSTIQKLADALKVPALKLLEKAPAPQSKAKASTKRRKP